MLASRRSSASNIFQIPEIHSKGGGEVEQYRQQNYPGQQPGPPAFAPEAGRARPKRRSRRRRRSRWGAATPGVELDNSLVEIGRGWLKVLRPVGNGAHLRSPFASCAAGGPARKVPVGYDGQTKGLQASSIGLDELERNRVEDGNARFVFSRRRRLSSAGYARTARSGPPLSGQFGQQKQQQRQQQGRKEPTQRQEGAPPPREERGREPEQQQPPPLIVVGLSSASSGSSPAAKR